LQVVEPKPSTCQGKKGKFHRAKKGEGRFRTAIGKEGPFKKKKTSAKIAKKGGVKGGTKGL